VIGAIVKKPKDADDKGADIKGGVQNA